MSAVQVYSYDATGEYPVKLEDIMTEHFQTKIPKCLCKDGIERDFLYVPGFRPCDGMDWVGLVTPPEMDPEKAIVFYFNLSYRVVEESEANDLVGKSRAYLQKREFR